MTAGFWIRTGAVTCGLSVALGAMAAHGLEHVFVSKYAAAKPRLVAGVETPLAAKYLADFKTGARYQMYHGLALIVCGLLIRTENRRGLNWAASCFLLGTVLFSGGLYLYTLTGQVFWGAGPPPLGGTLFIVGWIVLAANVPRSNFTSANRAEPGGGPSA